MKKFSLLEPTSRQVIENAAKKYGLDPEEIKSVRPPQEDFILASEKYPIFVVADGVTLIQFLIDKKDRYPDPSPAGEAAQIFCQTLIEAAEERYESFNEFTIREIFKIANEAVGQYNREQGRTKQSTDYWNNDLYAATAAFVVVKDKRIYWGSICDSYVARWNAAGELIFKSPDWLAKTEAEALKFNGDANNPKERAQYVWSVKRNGVNNEGKLIGYGVVTGEEIANHYLNVGSFAVDEGDVVAILTDGFENYISLPEFIDFFVAWPADLENKFKNWTAAKAAEDPEKFGHERSLIAISS